MRKKILAGLMSTALLCSLIPASYSLINNESSSFFSVDGAEAVSTVVYSTGFEDGINDFTGRGGVETLQIVNTDSYSGTNCLECSNRGKGWHGPWLALEGLLEPGIEYMVSAKAKAQWYNNINLKLDYTDSSGQRHYVDILSAVSQGDWVEMNDGKFIIPNNVTNVYLYFECNDTANMYIDDFEIKTAPVYEIQQDIPSLKDIYSSYFKIGGAVTTTELASKTAQDLIKKHYNSLTPGNELKPESILDQAATIASGSETNPVVNIASAREILDFCRDNNISVRGHVLVWHSQTPDWFFKEGFTDSGDWVSKEIMLQRMENYIKNVFEALETEYPTVDFYAWDVVNEAWLDNGSPRTGGGQSENPNYSGWVKIFGDNSFIEPAFEYAKKYAPEGCKLYYNDFNEYMPDKTNAIVNMANELKEKGLIDGIGMQSHLDVGFPSASAYKKALKAFVDTGLDIQVTELDITTTDLTESGFEKQAQIYNEIMDACEEYSDSISAVVFWGTTDDKSWRAAKCPLLFNEDFTAKPAYYSIIEGLTPKPTETPSTDITEYSKGDIDKDKLLTTADIVLMQKYLLKIYTFDESQYSLADMNSDDKVNIFDCILLKRIIIDLETPNN